MSCMRETFYSPLLVQTASRDCMCPRVISTFDTDILAMESFGERMGYSYCTTTTTATTTTAYYCYYCYYYYCHYYHYY